MKTDQPKQAMFFVIGVLLIGIGLAIRWLWPSSDFASGTSAALQVGGIGALVCVGFFWLRNSTRRRRN
jgi:hypothetical protein